MGMNKRIQLHQTGQAAKLTGDAPTQHIIGKLSILYYHFCMIFFIVVFVFYIITITFKNEVESGMMNQLKIFKIWWVIVDHKNSSEKAKNKKQNTSTYKNHKLVKLPSSQGMPPFKPLLESDLFYCHFFFLLLLLLTISIRLIAEKLLQWYSKKGKGWDMIDGLEVVKPWLVNGGWKNKRDFEWLQTNHNKQKSKIKIKKKQKTKWKEEGEIINKKKKDG